jgi:hypothetical protein
MEQGPVTRLRRVDAVWRPLPDEAIAVGGKLCVGDGLPEAEVLADLMHAQHTVDVSGPAVRL